MQNGVNVSVIQHSVMNMSAAILEGLHFFYHCSPIQPLDAINSGLLFF